MRAMGYQALFVAFRKDRARTGDRPHAFEQIGGIIAPVEHIRHRQSKCIANHKQVLCTQPAPFFQCQFGVEIFRW